LKSKASEKLNLIEMLKSWTMFFPPVTYCLLNWIILYYLDLFNRTNINTFVLIKSFTLNLAKVDENNQQKQDNIFFIIVHFYFVSAFFIKISINLFQLFGPNVKIETKCIELQKILNTTKWKAFVIILPLSKQRAIV
jgi:hypothetical protein